MIKFEAFLIILLVLIVILLGAICLILWFQWDDVLDISIDTMNIERRANRNDKNRSIYDEYMKGYINGYQDGYKSAKNGDTYIK